MRLSGVSLDLGNAYVAGAIDHPKGDQQPDDNADHDDDVEDLFDLPIHREISVDQPEQDSDDD